jgi:hypothetical protein
VKHGIRCIAGFLSGHRVLFFDQSELLLLRLASVFTHLNPIIQVSSMKSSILNFLIRSLLLLVPILSTAQITITFPLTYLVMQRDNNNSAKITVTGQTAEPMDRIEARLVPRPGEWGVLTNWRTIAVRVSGGFSGIIEGTGGRYDLEIRGTKNSVSVVSIVEKVGIGEVFLIVGHSNAAGENRYSYATVNDMVSSINNRLDSDREVLYHRTASTDHLLFQFSQLCLDCGMSPFGYTSGMWSKLGELLVEDLHVPVLFYSAAFGGSNMLQTKKSANGELFEHSFIRSNIGMPYINIANTLNYYVPKTGLRAVLSMHGINDAGSTKEEFLDNHMFVINKTRSYPGFSNLAWLIARSCYNDGVVQHILDAQLSLFQNTSYQGVAYSNVFKGPNLNVIGNEYRGNPDLPVGDPNRDRLHFNSEGVILAGEYWRNAITNASTNFLALSTPIMAQIATTGPLPVSLVSFTGKVENHKTRLDWSTADETSNSHFDIEYSSDAKTFGPIGRVEGSGDRRIATRYDFTIDTPMAETAYYRLKQTDFNGSFSYSRTIVVTTPYAEDALYILPNPTTQQISVNGRESDQIKSLSVIDHNGRVVLEKTGTKVLDVSDLPNGDYILLSKHEDGNLTRRKFVKF